MEHNEITEIQHRYVTEIKQQDGFIKSHPELFLQEDGVRKSLFYSDITLQVSKFGFVIFSEYYTMHEYTPEEYLNSYNLIKLSKYFKYPFYTSHRAIFLFCDEEQAFFINLCGNIETYLKTLS